MTYNYYYEALNQRGEIICSNIFATNEENAIQELRSIGLYPLKLLLEAEKQVSDTNFSLRTTSDYKKGRDWLFWLMIGLMIGIAATATYCTL